MWFVRALAVGAALATAACSAQPSSTPVGPSAIAPQPANYAGEWTVTYHVDSSIGRYAFTRVGREFDLTLRLQQLGDRVTGAFLSNGLVTDVDGRVDPAGRLSLTGREPSPIPDRGSLELLRFEAALDAAQGLTGALHYQSLIPGEHSWWSTGATGPIVRADRRPLAIGSFAGTWTGFFNTMSCLGARFCLLDYWNDLTLELQDSGSQVAGELQLFSHLRIAVAGVAAGDGVELVAGDGPYAGSRVRIRRSSTGRLYGSATIASGWQAELDLLSVALAPQP